MEGDEHHRMINLAKKVIVIEDKAPDLPKEGKLLQMKLGSKSKKSMGKTVPEKATKRIMSVREEKMVTVDEDDATYDTVVPVEKAHEVEATKLSCCRKVFGNTLCPLCGVTRWRKKPKILYTDAKAKDICSHILCRFNSMYYYFANQLGPEIKYFAEELFFKKGQIEADGLCAITAQIWAATYLLQFEVTTMKEEDWNDIRRCYLNLVWESQKIGLENKKFYDLHQEFQKNIFEHLEKLDSIVGKYVTEFSELDPPPDPKAKRIIDGLFFNEELMLKHHLALLVSPPHEESIKFDDFSEYYRIKTIKYFLNISPMNIITLGQSVIAANYDILQSGNLPLLTPNFPVNKSKFTYSEGMEMLEEDLKELFDTVIVPKDVQKDLLDWTDTIKEVIEQYSSYGQWITDKINEMKEMSQLCYEYADKAYSMELPPMSFITNLVGKSSALTESEEDALKPKLLPCKIPINQRIPLAEKYHSFHDTLENFKWADFFTTEYHEVCTRLPIMYGPTEYLFLETRRKISGNHVLS